MNFTKTIVNALKYWATDKLNKKVDKEDFIALKNAKPDWNQNDSSADDYVKNRPFYSLGPEEVVTNVLPKTTCAAGTNSVTLSTSLVEGQTYTVTWDGVAYECVARNYEGYLMLGNNAIYEYDNGIETDTGEPFAMETNGDDTELHIFVAEEKDFTLAISYTEIKENITKLPMKYLPDGYPYKEESTGTIIAETTINIDSAGNPCLDPFAIEFIDGETYIVIWDGTTYECVSYVAQGPNSPSIGNGEGVGVSGGNGEPFFCTVFNGQVLLFASETGEHTISIDGVTKKVVKMAKEYLPDSNVVTGVLEYSSYNWYRLNLERGANAQELIKAANDKRLAGIYVDYSYRTGWLWFVDTIQEEDIYGYIFQGILTHTNYSYGDPIFTNELCSYILPEAIDGNPNYDTLVIGDSIIVPNIRSIGSAHKGAFLRVTDYSSNEIEPVQITPDLIGAIPAPSSATVGQMLRVKAVDENGIVTECEAVNNLNSINLIDQVNGYAYTVCMRNGNLVTYCAIERIEVTTMPTKTEYVAGEYFDPSGMIMSATTYDGTTKEITDNFICPTEYLTEEMTSINISYIEGGVTHTTTVPVTVAPFDPAVQLIDFNYIANSDGTYTLTGWKGTYNGEASTEIIVPNNGLIRV